jgi:Domain of unknown function (DU1801)
MPAEVSVRIRSLLQLYELLPEEEKLIVDVLRHLVIDHLPNGFKEKISFNVPYFYGKKGVCIIWPATIPRGGIKEGVLFGFWYGNKMNDVDQYLTHGTNKQIFYKIYKKVSEIRTRPLIKLLKEAVRIDRNW